MKHANALIIAGVFVLVGSMMIKANESTGDIARPKSGGDGRVLIRANGLLNCITTGPSDSLTINVEMSPDKYVGVNADWWVAVLTESSWYYLDSSMQWVPFDGCLPNIFPAHQGPLFNMSPTTILHCAGLPVGSYRFIFAVDECDGIVTIYSYMLWDILHVTVK